MTDYEPLTLDALPGTDPDNTEFQSKNYIALTRMRFYRGKPQTVGGWDELLFEGPSTLTQPPRMIYSQIRSDRIWYLIGTFGFLYANTGTDLTNITPLVVATTNLGNNPITTYFPTLANDPFAVTLGSTDVTVTHTVAPVLIAGDTVVIAGASGAVGGIPQSEFNDTHIVRSVTAGVSFVITLSTTATSSATGGGNSATLGSGLITVAQTTHGFSNGDRVKLLAATTTGGITDVQINLEHLIRNKGTSTYDILTAGASTSAVTGGGTAPVTVQGQIAVGNQDAATGVGYSAGQHSSGQYSSALVSSATLQLPRLWQGDRFGQNMLVTPGEGTGLYQWTGSTAVAPALVTNAPTSIDGFFVFKNIVVTYKDDHLEWNDLGNLTTWTSLATNYAGSDDIEGAGKFIADALTRDFVVLFTTSKVYVLTFIDLPFVFDLGEEEVSDGIIAQNARYSVNGTVYWMGNDNFYQYSGGAIEVSPNNTVVQTVIDNYNRDQKSKIHCEYIRRFNQLVWHIPWQTDTDNSKRVGLNLTTNEWWIDDDPDGRTASEFPRQLGTYHLMADSTGSIFRHEVGVDDDGSALNASLEGPWFNVFGKGATDLGGIMPDSVQTENITVTVKTRKFVQRSSDEQTITRTVGPTDNMIDFQTGDRFFKFTVAQNTLGGKWRMGKWQVLTKQGARLE